MKEIVVAKPIVKIPCMEKPPVEGGEIAYLTPEEFQHKFNCTYTEGVYVKQSQKAPAVESDFKDARAKAAYERLMHPLEGLVICKMSHDIGYGLFTTQDIPFGTLMCLYAGEYYPDSPEFAYACEGIDAIRIGGVARFMQYQPASKEIHRNYLMQGLMDSRLFAIQENVPEEQAKRMLANPRFISKKIEEYELKIEENESFGGYDFDQYRFHDKQLKDQVAQSNVVIETTEVAGVDVKLMIASRDIRKNESIGFSYGVMYWLHTSIPTPPLLFTKTGQITLPQNHYTYRNHEAIEEAKRRLATKIPLFRSPYDRVVQQPSLFASHTDKVAAAATAPPKPIVEKINPPQPRQQQDLDGMKKELEGETISYFKQPVSTKWKKYPELKLIGKYIGHQVCFFTMAPDKTSQAIGLTEKLRLVGFDAELKQAGEKPSIVVDLTTSKCAL